MINNLSTAFVFLFFLFQTHLAGAQQNLVPNGSFEEYNLCPTDISQIGYSVDASYFPTVKYWVNPLDKTTPDYFNTCAPNNSAVKLPYTILGYQHARTGNGCAGIGVADGIGDLNPKQNIVLLDTPTLSSEYIECKLLSPLKAGKLYDVSFFVSFSYDSTSAPNTPMPFNYAATDQIGGCFSDTLVHSQSEYNLFLSYSIGHTPGSFIDDTSKWVKISGIYKARGGEQYFTIGRFSTTGIDEKFKVIYHSPLNPDPPIYSSYYFIDDVSVIEIVCDTVTNRQDTVSCKREIRLSRNISADSYEWNTGENSRDIVVNRSGIYWRKAVKGCHLTVDSFNVQFGTTEYCNECKLLVPSAFSPNRDGLNDKLSVIANCELLSFNIKIYNRWGNLVFESNDIAVKWDGSYRGKSADVGTYFFVIKYSTSSNFYKTQKGDVTVLR